MFPIVWVYSEVVHFSGVNFEWFSLNCKIVTLCLEPQLVSLLRIMFMMIQMSWFFKVWFSWMFSYVVFYGILKTENLKLSLGRSEIICD